jgi:thymidylate kinase
MGTVYLPPPLGLFAYHFFASLLPKPRKTIFLEVDPGEAHRRILKGGSQKEMFESSEQLEKISSRALALARSKGWAVVDATGSEEVVGDRVWAELRRAED